MNKTQRRLWIWTSIFFALFASLPSLMRSGCGWFFLHLVLAVFGFGILLLALFVLYRHLQNLWRKNHLRNFLFHGPNLQGNSHTLLRNLMILLVILWIPAFLAFYPGTFGADAPIQLAMFDGILPMTNHHPLFHTIIMGSFINFGAFLFRSANFGLALYIFFCQILFCAYAISRSLVYLYKKGIQPWYLYLAAALLAISPFNQALVCYTTKDIPFAAALLLFVVSSCEFLFPPDGFREAKRTSPKKSGLFSSLFSKGGKPLIPEETWQLYQAPGAVLGWGFLMTLLRSQGVYMAAVGVILCIALFRLFKPRKRFSLFVIVQVMILILAWVFTSALPKMTGIAISNPREALALPIYQIASAITENEESDHKFLSPVTLEEALDYFNQYDPQQLDSEPDSADYPKSIFLNDKFSENPGRFFWVYTKVVFSSPACALQSASRLIAPYFDMRLSPYNGLITVTSYEEYSRKVAISSASLLPGYKGYLKGLIAASSAAHCPGWLRLFDPAAILYLLIFMLGLAIFYKNGLLWIAVLYPVLYVLTMLLGPVSLLRYSFVYDIQAPFLTGILFLALHQGMQPKIRKKARSKSRAAGQKAAPASSQAAQTL